MCHTMAGMDRLVFSTPTPQYLNAITIPASQVIADTGEISIFVMEGMLEVITKSEVGLNSLVAEYVRNPKYVYT